MRPAIITTCNITDRPRTECSPSASPQAWAPTSLRSASSPRRMKAGSGVRLKYRRAVTAQPCSSRYLTSCDVDTAHVGQPSSSPQKLSTNPTLERCPDGPARFSRFKWCGREDQHLLWSYPVVPWLPGYGRHCWRVHLTAAHLTLGS